MTNQNRVSMKTIAMIITSALLLTSCTSPTQSEIDEKKKLCALDGNGIEFMNWPFGWHIACKWKQKETPVMECIREYTDWIDEKYNNLDTVTNLREDAYSNVVKVCNETFSGGISK